MVNNHLVLVTNDKLEIKKIYFKSSTLGNGLACVFTIGAWVIEMTFKKISTSVSLNQQFLQNIQFKKILFY